MDTDQLPKAAYRRLDLFPAEVIGRNGYKRVVATDSYLIILGESTTGPQIESVEALYDFQGNNKVGWTAELEDGSTLLIRRAQGCGCGSRLRGAKIYQGVPLKRA